MNIPRRASVVILSSLMAVLAPLGTAGARPIQHEHFQDSSSRVISDFCDSLRIREHVQVRGSVLVKQQGASKLAYFIEHFHGVVTRTNLANGTSVIETFHNVFKDHKVIDNGDGTLTIVVLATGSNKLYGPDGRLLLNDPGQIRFAVVIDHGGTPADPSDDEFLQDLGLVKSSTGRNDFATFDFCEVVTEAIA
jgi:hypothetical protein